ncbi:PEBP-like protein [Heliocybe sulcata]|uniref:PEBP-like protein n=1 Tax=Heliocybe sulcata TaxID=5364 RepID=A0A5C3MPU6_9AGAM|nr:PEBP-like protein [Heliocybe sulcata]
MPLLDPLSTVVTALKRESIIPDVLPEEFYPSMLFSVVWPNGKEAVLGNELTREDALDEPSINFAPMNVPAEQADSAGGEELAYTVVMLDPDAPGRADPKFKCFRHWVITGLRSPPVASLQSVDLLALKSKSATTPYRPPGPPPGTGEHRYVFLLFQEPPSAPLAIPEGAVEYGAALEERRSWNALDFAKKYGLKLVGANFFICRSTE